MLTAQSPAAAPGRMRLPVLTPPALAAEVLAAPALAAPALADATVLDEPHVWLGLPADETCPGRIAAAARKRLDAIRDAGGTDDAVKEAVIGIIVAARQALLARAIS